MWLCAMDATEPCALSNIEALEGETCACASQHTRATICFVFWRGHEPRAKGDWHVSHSADVQRQWCSFRCKEPIQHWGIRLPVPNGEHRSCRIFVVVACDGVPHLRT
jgi:hypothetical protein